MQNVLFNNTLDCTYIYSCDKKKAYKTKAARNI